jgi:mobilome CxxCx(11)CxxC protein
LHECWDWAYYIESKTANYRLEREYKKLGQATTLSPTDFETNLKILDTENEMRNALDDRHDITDNEKRMGMRYALREHERKCSNCDKIPKSMRPTDCDICGNF